jgi:hypothetical protein
LTAAGLLVVPAAVLTASVPAHTEPVAAPAPQSAQADGGPVRPGDLTGGPAFRTQFHRLVGYDPASDTLVAQPESMAEVAALDARTGAVRWRHDLTTAGAYGTVLWSQPDLGGGTVLVNTFRRDTAAGELAALSTRTGEVRWAMPLTDRTEAMASGPVVIVSEPAADSRPDALSGGSSDAFPGASPDAFSGGSRDAAGRDSSSGVRGGSSDAFSGGSSDAARGDSSDAARGDSSGGVRGGASGGARSDLSGGAPAAGTFSAVSVGGGDRLWGGELPEGCDVEAAAGDGSTVAIKTRCEDGAILEIRDARDGTLRSRTTLDNAQLDGAQPADDGLGLLVRDGATIVRGARSFQLFAPGGRRLVDRDGDGCVEFCAAAVEGDTVIVAHSGGRTDRTDGALEAFALADGTPRWRAERTVRALVRTGGRLYAVGPAPDPIPFLAVTGVGARGVSAQYATEVPAKAAPQPGSALLVEGDGGELAWYRIRPVEPPAGYLGSAATWPDPCGVLPRTELTRRLPRQRVSARRTGDTTCTFTGAKGPVVHVAVLWSGADEASTLRRYQVIGKTEAVQRFGTLLVSVTTVRDGR